MLENVRTLMILLSGIMVCCVRPPSTPDFSKSSKIETEKPDDNGYEEQDGSIDHHTEEAGTGGSSGDSKSEITLKGTQVSNAVTSVFNKPILSETFNLSLKSLSAIGATKGDVVTIKISVANSGAKSGRVKIRPYLTSQNYDDFQNIQLPSFDLDVKGNELKTSEFKISPFFKEDNGNREYALNRGNYDVSFQVEGDFKADWKAMSFVVAPSNAVFTAVFWSQPYFDKIGYKGNIDSWLRETFSRKSQTSDGGNLYASYEKVSIR